MARDAQLRSQLMQRYRGALELASAEQMALMLERFAAEVSAAAPRDALRWDAAYREYFGRRMDFLTHDEEIDYLRTWIPARWSLLAGQLDP